MAPEEVHELQSAGKLVFIIDNKVYKVPDDFVHPGGNHVCIECVDMFIKRFAII